MTRSITIICHYAECHILFIIMLNVVMLSVVLMSVVVPIMDKMSFEEVVVYKMSVDEMFWDKMAS